METRGYRIAGRVQGVGFRYWAQKRARALELRGYVRNRPDGSVEVVAAGTPEQLAQFEALLQDGPSAAQVASIEPFQPAQEPPPGFHITS